MMKEMPLPRALPCALKDAKNPFDIWYFRRRHFSFLKIWYIIAYIKIWYAAEVHYLLFFAFMKPWWYDMMILRFFKSASCSALPLMAAFSQPWYYEIYDICFDDKDIWLTPYFRFSFSPLLCERYTPLIMLRFSLFICYYFRYIIAFERHTPSAIFFTPSPLPIFSF